MAVIHVMSPHMTNMIAAGEVVDRPVNIVKECAENSLDAGADVIDIEVFEGGISGVIVTDNGCGMDYQDAGMAFERHATSKLQSEEDLFAISTMGFRGEALPSIASVAEVEMQTSDGVCGTRIRMEYGERTVYEKADCPRGTRIEVRGLFVRTPARFKYLKRPSYEFSIISDVVSKMAMSHPDVRFTLRHDGRVIFQSSGKNDRWQILYQMFGADAAKNAVAFSGEAEDYIISGLAVQPKISRASRQYIYVSINGRLVRSWPIVNAVIEGYREYLPKERFPIVYLNIETDPQLIDVNVHPNKWEVRLSKEDVLFELISRTISQLFEDALVTPSIEKKPERTKAPEQPRLNFQYPGRPVSSLETGRKPEGQPAALKSENQIPFAASAMQGSPFLEDYEQNNGQARKAFMENSQLSSSVFRKEERARFGGGLLREADQGFSKPAFSSQKEMPDFLKEGAPSALPSSASPSGKPLSREQMPAPTEKSENQISETAEFSAVRPENAPEPAENVGSENQMQAADTAVDEITSQILAREAENSESRGMEFFHHLHVIGQLHDSYILCENGQGLVIIDQHAAQERANFERLMRRFDEMELQMQPLLVPLQLDLSAALMNRLDEINAACAPYGLQFEPFSQSRVLLREVPDWMNRLDPERFVSDLFDSFETQGKVDMAELRRHFIATMACHSSIRFNRPLTREEMEQVIIDLQQCVNPYHCPHGRPTVIVYSEKELRKEFERG